MDTKTKYKTKQHDQLLCYLAQKQGEHITAGDVCAYFKAQGAAIGQATVYRQLEKLVDEGLVQKYVIDGSSPACFEYVGPHAHDGAQHCFHCKCEKCGKLIHLHCDELAMIAGHLRSAHGFRLDPQRTVFYGLCAQCAGSLNAEQTET